MTYEEAELRLRRDIAAIRAEKEALALRLSGSAPLGRLKVEEEVEKAPANPEGLRNWLRKRKEHAKAEGARP